LRYLATVGSDEQSGSSGAYGGFLIPEGFRAELLALGTEEDVLGAQTTKIPMQTPSVTLPALANVSHATSVVGGITASFTPETAEASLSRSKFEKVTLNAQDLVAMVAVTDNLMQDSPLSVAAIMAQNMGRAIRSVMIDKRLNGTGVGEPEGIVNSAALISVGSSNSDAITAENLFGMLSRFWSTSGRGLWLCNRTTMPKLAAITNGNVQVWQPSLQTGVPSMLLGYPVQWTEYLPENTEKNAVLLVDPSAYLDGYYGGEQYAEDASVRFLAREKILRVVQRVDGKPWIRSAITPAKGSTTLSPFVALADRS
jgi:HK97 family phage major capsid protein